MPNFAFCLRRARERSGRDLSGLCRLTLRVSSDRRVEDASARAERGLRRDVADCVAEAAARWRPPSCDQGPYTLSVEIEFDPDANREPVAGSSRDGGTAGLLAGAP
jgi:hypothetical protein